MAQGENKEINQLEQATEIQDADLFVLEQEDKAKKLLGSTIKSYAEEAGINAIREIYPRTPASNDPDNSVFHVEIPDAGEAPMHSTVIKGKTVAVNQLCENGDFADATGWSVYSSAKSTMAVSGNVCTQTIIDNTGVNFNFMVRRPNNANGAVLGHKYFVSCEVLAPRAMAFVATYSDNAVYSPTAVTANTWTTVAAIGNGAARTLSYFAVQPNDVGDIQIGDVYKYRNAKVIDLNTSPVASRLTEIGTDVAKLKQVWLEEKGTPLPQYIPYDAGSLANVNGVYRLHGRNLWDEEWEVGGISSTTGNNEPNPNIIRSKNYIPVNPLTTYYFKAPVTTYTWLQIRAYDENIKFLGALNPTLNTAVTLSLSSVRYIRFQETADYGTTYKHDICINISDPTFNGQYEKHYNGGSIVCSAAPLNGFDDTVCDTEDYATGERKTKMALVDIGQQTIGYSSGHAFFYFNITDARLSPINLLSPIYSFIGAASDSGMDNVANMSIAYANGSGTTIQVKIKNTAYSDAATFKTAMSGVYLCYELATPVTTTETPQPVYTQYGYNCFEPVSGSVQSAEVNLTYYENIAGYIDRKLAEA